VRSHVVNELVVAGIEAMLVALYVKCDRVRQSAPLFAFVM